MATTEKRALIRRLGAVSALLGLTICVATYYDIWRGVRIAEILIAEDFDRRTVVAPDWLSVWQTILDHRYLAQLLGMGSGLFVLGAGLQALVTNDDARARWMILASIATAAPLAALSALTRMLGDLTHGWPLGTPARDIAVNVARSGVALQALSASLLPLAVAGLFVGKQERRRSA